MNLNNIIHNYLNINKLHKIPIKIKEKNRKSIAIQHNKKVVKKKKLNAIYIYEMKQQEGKSVYVRQVCIVL